MASSYQHDDAAENYGMCELPSGWAMATLGGITVPRGLRMKPSEMPGAPFIGLQHVEAHTMQMVGMGSTDDVKSSASYFGPGDVLYGRLRPYLNKVCQPSFEGLASGEFIVFSRQPSLDNTYLQYFLNRLEFVSAVTSMNTGDRPRVNFDQFADLPFPLPPLPEQRRIVVEIEKQFTRLDASVDGLKRAQANLKRYRASVLKAACEGKLVPTEAELARAEGRDYEPADRLLERILVERRAQWESQERRRGKYKEPVAPDISGLSSLPEGWVWAGLNALTQNLDAQRVPVKAEDRDKMQGRYPYYGASGVIDSVNDYLFDGTFLLVAEDGANLLSRSTPIAFIAEGQFWVNNHAHVLKPIGHLLLGYFETYFNGLNVQHYVTGTAQPKLTQTALNRIPVPLPPLPEQHRIVAEVERHLSVIQKAEDAVDAGLKRAERLRQSILKQAFSGQLVPQDPDDEPASALLERIRVEREAAEAEAKAKRKPRRRSRNSASARQLTLQEGNQ